MRDKFGREINYLRVSLTDKCNFRCIYCMPAEGVPLVPHSQILTIEEIAYLINFLSDYGIRYIRLTGGEPLVRKGIVTLLELIGKNPKIEEISLTTNGYFLEDMAEDLKKNGIRRVNISLDTLDPEKFRKITRTGELTKVLRGIEKAKEAGFSPIKLNSVIMRGVNEEDLIPLISFARENGLEIRFIELMPNSHLNGDFKRLFVSNDELKERIPYKMTPRKKTGNGPEDTYILEDGTKIGFISAITHNFCHLCNRLRLTSMGTLNPCLMSPIGIDLKGALRPRPDREKLKELIDKTLLLKPEGHTEEDYIANISKVGG